jgi:predicted amidohydrolase YtcJ
MTIRAPCTTNSIAFLSGVVYTVNPARPWAQALVVSGNRITYVGSDQGAGAYIAPGTKVIDLGGRMLLPGFVEAHIHFIHGAATDNRDLPLARFGTKEEVFRALETFARDHPGRDPVLARGWKHFIFPEGPTKEPLDRIFPDRPVQLTSVDGHSSWVNSKALYAAGVDRNHPDPQPGFSYFVRDESGEPTGFIMEMASETVTGALVTFDREFIRAAVERTQPGFSAVGLTTVYDAGTMPLDEDDVFRTLQDLERDGGLDLRVVGSHVVLQPGDARGAIARLQAMRDKYNSDQVRASVLKLYLDGVPETYTAMLLEPYADRPDFQGESNLAPGVFHDLVLEADRLGVDVHVHAIGEGATRMVLDAVEAARAANGWRDARHTSCHVYYVDPNDLSRFRKLGVVAQTSGEWILWDDFHELMVARIGPERTQQLYRLNTLVHDGATLTLGSDWPASGNIVSYNPLLQIEMAHTRRPPGEKDARMLPPEDERLGLPEAIAAMTISGARQLRLEDKIGTLEAGKLADLIVLDENLFDIPPHQIHGTRVLLTMMDGRIVHRDPQLADREKPGEALP